MARSYGDCHRHARAVVACPPETAQDEAMSQLHAAAVNNNPRNNARANNRARPMRGGGQA